LGEPDLVILVEMKRSGSPMLLFGSLDLSPIHSILWKGLHLEGRPTLKVISKKIKDSYPDCHIYGAAAGIMTKQDNMTCNAYEKFRQK
jgi:hypothetical protein